MIKLVYLLCSLPSLSYGQSPPISIDELHEDAKQQLSSSQAKMLEMTDIRNMEGKVAKKAGKQIASLMEDLQKDLSEIRSAIAQNRSPKLNHIDKSIPQQNPLEREKQIMKWEWEELNSIVSGKTFTFTELIVYKLKLQILFRLQSFNDERGAGILTEVVNPKTEEAV